MVSQSRATSAGHLGLYFGANRVPKHPDTPRVMMTFAITNLPPLLMIARAE
jgi:hypothetical protein